MEVLSSSSARVSWRTSLPARTQGAYGLTGASVWTEPGHGVEHETLFSGLEYGTAYRLWLQATDDWGRVQETTLDVTTPPPAEDAAATTEGGAVRLDGEPFFPRMVWGQCPEGATANMQEGINVFMGDACGSPLRLFDVLRGRAFAILPTASHDGAGAGALGWHHPDEWDHDLPATVSAGELEAAEPRAEGRLTFLTLTNHFYSRAEPLPQGRGAYPALAALPDVLGFDLYPLQSWCREDEFEHVYEAQRELEALAPGKPTFQWVEARVMEHCPVEHLTPTPETVRAETWLAVAGGADAVGYFPNSWSEEVGEEIERSNRQLKELAPALLAGHVEATSDSEAVKVAARTLAGALYVIAVNSSRFPVDASMRVPRLGDRGLLVYDELRHVSSAADTFADGFAPLDVHIYIAPPEGWSGAETAPLAAEVHEPTTAEVDVGTESLRQLLASAHEEVPGT